MPLVLLAHQHRTFTFGGQRWEFTDFFLFVFVGWRTFVAVLEACGVRPCKRLSETPQRDEGTNGLVKRVRGLDVSGGIRKGG